MPDGRSGYHHVWLAPEAAGVSTPKDAFESDAVLAGVFPFALPTCIDLLPFVDAGYSIETEFSSAGAQPTKMLVGKLESEGRQVSVTVTESDGTVRGMVNYASGLR